MSSRLVEPGSQLPCARDLHLYLASARGRRNLDCCVACTAFLEPCGIAGRDAFYEQQLLQGLPWHCYKKPGTVSMGGHETTRWFFETDAPVTPEALKRFSMTERFLDATASLEDMSLAFERAYAANAEGVLCECCQTRGCEGCKLAKGWHICDGDRAALAAVLSVTQQPEPRWKAGTLHA